MVSFASRIVMLGFASLLAGCAISPPHPALRDADLPELIPLRKVVANVDSTGGHQISPDGRKLLWSHVIHIGDARSNKLVLVSNRRDAAVFDVYTADLASGKVEMAWRNAGDVARWIMDVDGQVGARVRRQDDQNILQVLNKATNTWKSVRKWSQFDIVWPIRIDRATGTVLMSSNTGRDKTALVEFNLADGRERVLFEHSSGFDFYQMGP